MVIAMVITVVTELQQVSTYTVKVPPHGVGPSMNLVLSTSGQALLHIGVISSQISHVLTQFTLHVLNFKFPRNLICNLHLAS